MCTRWFCRDFSLLESRLRARHGDKLPQIWAEVRRARSLTGAARYTLLANFYTLTCHLVDSYFLSWLVQNNLLGWGRGYFLKT